MPQLVAEFKKMLIYSCQYLLNDIDKFPIVSNQIFLINLIETN